MGGKDARVSLDLQMTRNKNKLAFMETLVWQKRILYSFDLKFVTSASEPLIFSYDRSMMIGLASNAKHPEVFPIEQQ